MLFVCRSVEQCKRNSGENWTKRRNKTKKTKANKYDIIKVVPDTRTGEKKTIWVKDLNNARTIQVGYKHNTRTTQVRYKLEDE